VTIDERIEALTESVELLTADVRALQESTSKLKDAAYALLTIAGQHERRLDDLEGGNGGKR
jgi:hypothetical protein